jgi:hypothetical protein
VAPNIPLAVRLDELNHPSKVNAPAPKVTPGLIPND